MVLQADSHDVSLVKNIIVMELYRGREGIQWLHYGLHSDYTVSREWLLTVYSVKYFVIIMVGEGTKGDWDFQISGLVKIPDGTDIEPLWLISVKSGAPG